MSEKETFKPLRSVTMSQRIDMPIALGMLEYAAGVDPKETWAAVTNDEIDVKEFDKIRNKHMDFLKEREPTKEFQDKLKGCMDEVIKLYQGILNGDGDAVKPYIDGRTFSFILGMPRTGGTTLYNGLSDAYEWPWEDLLLTMTHNFMPNGRYCVEDPDSEFDMGWRLPANFQTLVFELCQFLVYVNNEAPDSEHIFLKSTALSYAVKFLNYMFGEKANYFVTVRHPGAIVMTGEYDEEITRELHIANMLRWTNLYSSILRECRPVGRMRVVQYGQELTDVINAAFEQNKTGSRIEDTQLFEYDDYDKDFYESDNVKQMFEYVRASWALFDKDFPIPDKCI